MSVDPEKYDRQIRLWGEEAQSRLEHCHVCLLNGCALGTEILKNLVLPGIGTFTVVDGKKVEQADLGTNFFVDAASAGKSRAVVVTEFLRELNNRVKGFSVEEDPLVLIESNPKFFDQFTAVVAAQIPEDFLLHLQAILAERKTPLMIARSNGLVGYIKIIAGEHTVSQIHADNPNFDLRIAQPWPKLQQFIDSIVFETLDSALHAHIPHLVILNKIASRWRQDHNGLLPKTSVEKDQFKNVIIQTSRKYSNELNFQEAYAAAHKVWTPQTIPSNIRDIFADSKCSPAAKERSEFWIIAKAIKEFAENEGRGFLPLSGAVPDMTATTECYQEKAEEDALAVFKRVEGILESLGSLRGKLVIPMETIRSFCKNAANLQAIKYRTLGPENLSHCGQLGDATNNLLWYCAIRAADLFYSKLRHYPGAFDDQVESDIPELKKNFNSVISDRGLGGSQATDDVLHEMLLCNSYISDHHRCRFGGSELHSVAAFLGGVGAQELVKLVTQHFIPLNGTFVYNGIHCTTTVIQ